MGGIAYRQKTTLKKHQLRDANLFDTAGKVMNSYLNVFVVIWLYITRVDRLKCDSFKAN